MFRGGAKGRGSSVWSLVWSWEILSGSVGGGEGGLWWLGGVKELLGGGGGGGVDV